MDQHQEERVMRILATLSDQLDEQRRLIVDLNAKIDRKERDQQQELITSLQQKKDVSKTSNHVDKPKTEIALDKSSEKYTYADVIAKIESMGYIKGYNINYWYKKYLYRSVNATINVTMMKNGNWEVANTVDFPINKRIAKTYDSTGIDKMFEYLAGYDI